MNIRSLEQERPLASNHYDHAHWEARRRFLRFLIRTIGCNFLVRLEQIEGLENVPKEGPAILMINHIAFVDPIIVLHVVPRNIIPLAKIEVYNLPVVGIFPRIWGVIPVRREELDRRALQQALDVLQAREILLIAPEGTRGTQLQEGKEGIAYIASRTGVPVIPVAIDGTIGFPTFRLFRRWREPGAVLRFGHPFRFRAELNRPDRFQLRQMTDEAMYVLSALLPEHRRGVYADLSQATQETIEWL
jgi:1-acyl-sn-glycerol-3-phosphate acyltransferase